MDIVKHFMLAGYNRLGRSSVFLLNLKMNEAEVKGLRAGTETVSGILPAIQALVGADFTLPASMNKSMHTLQRGEDQAALLLARTAIAIQRRAGHLVEEVGVDGCHRPGHSRPWFEYDHPDTGYHAAVLACELLTTVLDRDRATIDWNSADLPQSLHDRLDAFIADNAPLAMPADSRAIYEAARARNIPCVRMDRPPCDPISGDFRLREHGLLRLGQGHRQHTVDGTLCVSRSQQAHPLVRNRMARFARLAALGIPLAATRTGARWCLGATRAFRAARQIEGPVAMRPVQYSAGRATTLRPDGEAAIRRGAALALRYGDQVLVEPLIEGSTWLLPVSGYKAGTLLRQSRRGDHYLFEPVDAPDDSIARLGEFIARELGAGLIVVKIIAPEVSVPLQQSSGCVIDVDLAPHLDRLYTADDPELARVAGAFVDWIFPDPVKSRIPVIAVTGTNGKTTTCRLLSRMMCEAGYRTGLACSDGSLIDDEQISELEDGYLPGHYTVLDNPRTELAVLECTRGAAASTGLGFDRCSVAVCLNISEDHLNDRLGIRDLDEMAALKRTIVECADQAVVLNADDPRCLAMATHLGGRRIGLVSQTMPAGELLSLAGAGGVVGVVEPVAEVDWLVIHERGRRTPVVQVADVPICYQGRAVHNVSNALHAMLLGHVMDLEAPVIARGLSRLETSFDIHHGRLNYFHGLPFELVMDYAHNPDGLHHLKLFVQNTPVSGKRILNFSCAASNSDEFIGLVAAAAAGGFDHYVCKGFGLLYDRTPGEVPRLLHDGLLQAGVSADAISMVEDEFESIDHTLDMASSGDLVVIIGGKRKKAIWEWIAGYVDRRGVSCS